MDFKKDVGILIVDDEKEMIFDVMKEMLAIVGFPPENIFYSRDNEEALRIFLANEKIKIVFCDIDRIFDSIEIEINDESISIIHKRVREHTGHNLVSMIKDGTDRTFSFVINSGYSPDYLNEIAKEVGASGYITKPFRMEELADLTKRLSDLY
ncbi:MAG: response regulator [Patescibacteria group bacterium]